LDFAANLESPAPNRTHALQTEVPRTAAEEPEVGSRAIREGKPVHKAQILLVEDEAFVRGVTAEVLESAGYRVLAARNATEALELHRQALIPVNLLVTDVVLPDRSGPDLAEQLRALNPRVRVLLVSGYAEQLWLSQSVRGREYLAKPFSTEALLSKVRETLGSDIQ
jgi:two-component system, cell cycle sensor histidine kinase and response regulator CckA